MITKKIYLLIIVILTIAPGCSGPVSEQSETTAQIDEPMADIILYVGTYTEKEAHVDGKADGVYVYKLNPATGALTYLSTSERVVNPSYIVVHPNKKYFYHTSNSHF